MKNKRNNPVTVILLIILILFVLAVTAYLLLDVFATRNHTTVQNLINPPDPPTNEAELFIESRRPHYTADSPAGQLLAQALNEAWQFRIIGEPAVAGEAAVQEAEITLLDPEGFCSGLAEDMQSFLAEKVEQATRRSQIYDETGDYLPELLDDALCHALEQRLASASDFTAQHSAAITLYRIDDAWRVTEGSVLPSMDNLSPDDWAVQLLELAHPFLTPLELHYSIPADVQTVPAPPQENFHTSTDPTEIAALLASPDAVRLIGDRDLVWNPDIEFLENSEIRLYLDETLLVIQWQEVEQRPAATFAEVIVADGSQFRRKVAGDSFGSTAFMTTSGFARSCNAVLALGGDYYYHHARACGITVLDGKIERFNPRNADSCFITADGDMLFIYRDAYKPGQEDEVQKIVDDNNVVFSLAFGPVLIDNGQDVTPSWYPWGEINDEYARSAIGMLGDKHYLTVNLNCYPGHYFLARLQAVTDALLSRGCVKAYTLDGGQTATTVFNGELVNPVQFGREKAISDIIYFASALPEE